MNRRNFLRSMLGVAAATALPSEVWPFRKIFLPAPTRFDFLDLSHWGELSGLPAWHSIDQLNYFGLSRSEYPGRLTPSLSRTATAAQLQIDNVLNLQKDFFRKAALNYYDQIAHLMYTEGRVITKDGEIVRWTPSPVDPKDILGFEVIEVNQARAEIVIEPKCMSRRSLLHRKATAENVLEFIDDLEESI